MSTTIDAVDERLPTGKLAALGLQHVLVMYAGAIAVPLIIGRILKLSPQDVAFLISADLFVCGLATVIQSMGATQYFGIRLPVMMGVTFAAVGPMVAIGLGNPGIDGARMIFGSVIAAGVISIFIAPIVSRMLRFFPPVVTGTIIAVIGITLMRIGINWIFGLPVGPTSPKIVDPAQAQWLTDITAAVGASAGALPEIPKGLKIMPSMNNPLYANMAGIGVAGLVLLTILGVSKFAKGFVANISVLIGILVGGLACAAMGMMHFDKVASAAWFAPIMPFHFGMPIFDPVLIVTMTLVMIVVMIESTGMFLALGEMVERKVDQPALARGLRADGLGTLLGGLFNTFPYTSFSQNVGLVAVTGIRSRYVTIVGGLILIALGLIPKMGALVEALPTAVLGGAGLVMFGMVAATGIRILGGVDFKTNRHNAIIVAVALGFGMIPLIAPNFKMWMPHAIHPLIESGILLASLAAVLLNLFFNGAAADDSAAVQAAKQADSH
jgi:uric acid transporter